MAKASEQLKLQNIQPNTLNLAPLKTAYKICLMISIGSI